ncbi:polysaccharide deacetylase family protein [Gramella sp. GC03-9]|uniref:Polysaccharide deacetylase family protein n=1 Tax=Christiangramia oceanisediminis TaxID=2920386 RepID=A0A9X2L045_9FLAO|nr:polysaccharide deacetylase family protein [Gramella oceanisediminis]MCP9201560.1 polysaccharide deacetylase family protein [Gramella oceanisediminis]
MLLIYTQKVTPRIMYVFKHLCSHLLGIPIKFTSKIEEFIAHEGAKISYGKQALGNEFFIQKVDLLMEQGFSEIEIKIQTWDDTVCFFPLPESSDLPFDIFAASFYLLSRYEEYLPHVKDEAGRFPAGESLAAQESFLHKPVVDIWALKFLEILLDRFPDLEYTPRKFRTGSIITSENTFIYKNKGFLRSFMGMMLDLFSLQLGKVVDRLQVWTRLKDDPHNIFEDLIELIKEHNIYMIFMFQLSDFSIHDRNISHNRIPHRAVIKSVADYAQVGLLVGYYAMEDIQNLRKEKLRLEEIVHNTVDHVMNSKYDLKLPDHYNSLTELEITNDHSMGYPEKSGFRAGTCSPFLFYDINMEVTTPLKIHPYAFNSQIINTTNKTKVMEELTRMLEEVKAVDGKFRAVFKNSDFSAYSDKDLYYSFLKHIHEAE